jgi:hypothetical protein
MAAVAPVVIVVAAVAMIVSAGRSLLQKPRDLFR